ncbi:hypothetical protein CPB86DRAFT_398298 [Serendipita vermifera]|nr:hypothetical protein CPB86DRAFT_398298 [Serendipita vermifera]
MGPTGTGKSTFINAASGSNLRVGNDLQSCTAKVEPSEEFRVEGKRVILLDTPGFDDTEKEDVDILEEIADYMAKTYKEKRLLSGILYFHNIASKRMGGIAVRNLRLFRSLCGDNSLKSVVIVTNMWGEVDPATGQTREAQLKTNDNFFKPVVDSGGRFMQHHNTKESALEIVRSLLPKQNQEVLTIQAEMVDRGLSLDETEAAKQLLRDFDGLIQNIQRRIEREEQLLQGDSPKDRKKRQAGIKRMRKSIRELEDRKQMVGRGSTALHVAFLRTMKRLFKF